MKLTVNQGGEAVMRLTTTTHRHREELADTMTATLFYCMYVVGYMDREYRQLTEEMQKAGLYVRENKRTVNAIADSVNNLMRIQRFAHNESLRQVMDKTMRHWKPEYDRDNSTDIMLRLQTMAMSRCNTEWTKFQANLSNMLHRVVRREERKPAVRLTLSVNALANIMLTSISAMRDVWRRIYPPYTSPMQDSMHHVDSIIQHTCALSMRIAPETAHDKAVDIWSEAATTSLQEFSYSLMDNTREHTMQQFYQSDRSFLRWYMGRAVMEYRDRGRLPRPVVDEIKQAVSGHFLSLCKELKAWSRLVDADDDPLDIADRMEERSGSVYTRYTEMLIRRLLCDGELGKGMN
jgi:hypothetical protein